MKIVFFGTPKFAASVLAHIIDSSKHRVVGVVSKPNKAQGRDLKITPTDVARLHHEKIPNIPLFQPKKVSEEWMRERLLELDADLFVVVAYGEIIRPMILEIPKCGFCINIHASLLPKYRGAAPMQRALLDGASKSGVTIMRMDDGLDSGDIILMKEFAVPNEMNMGLFSERMLEVSKEALLEALDAIENKSARYTPQDHKQMTFAPKITAEELELFPSIQKAASIHNKVRAFSPKPGAYCSVRFREKMYRLKILQTSLIPKSTYFQSSSVLLIQDGDILRMLLPADSAYDLSIERVQLEGKKEMDIKSFLNGTPACELSIA